LENGERIQWHPAFRQAIKAELSEYHDVLDFIEEYQLTTEPLRIDTLIIKKPPEVNIDKNIGRIFRGHNIVEYKSPEESIVFDGYNKVFAYAYLYASLTHTDINDITITLVASNHPRDLLSRLGNDPRLEIEKTDNGIYNIKGERLPVQIIETKLLTENENLWLRSLRSGLTKAMLKRLADERKRYGGEISAYVYAVLEANEGILKGEAEMGLAKTLMEDPAWVREFEKLGYGNIAQEVAREVAREKLEIARNLLSLGDPVDKIVKATGLTAEEVESLRTATDTLQQGGSYSVSFD
jgi:hypothetical protein